MINNILYHEVSFQPPSGSYEGDPNSSNSQYHPVYGAFYSIVNIASELNPTGSELPQDYEGYPIFEIPRFKYGGTFSNVNRDDMGANTLEMKLVVENIGDLKGYNNPPVVLTLSHTVFTQDISTGDEFAGTPEKYYLNNTNWDVVNAPQFGIKYDIDTQSFFLQYWFSQSTDTLVIKGNYELF